MKTTKKGPKVGDSVIFHGGLHEIVEIEKQAYIDDDEKPQAATMAVWENERFRARGDANELAWSEEDDAWYLPGRVLSHDERTVLAAIMGSWPTAQAHMPLRTALDKMPSLGKLNMEALHDVVRTRRLARAENESAATFESRVKAYASAAIKHVEALRSSRAKREG